MATTNVSGDELEKQTTIFLQLHCLPDLTTGIHGQLTLISVLNSFLSITAFFGNALVLVALRKESSLHPPSKILLRNLATTDLCVGVISQPLYAAFLLTAVNEHWNVCRYVHSLFQALGCWGRAKSEREKKRGRTKPRNGGRACKTFFNDPPLV